tara:strand:- start:35 stop:1342 length:1308 start_codon:yes stop_codon:yes gene_type:complete
MTAQRIKQKPLDRNSRHPVERITYEDPEGFESVKRVPIWKRLQEIIALKGIMPKWLVGDRIPYLFKEKVVYEEHKFDNIAKPSTPRANAIEKIVRKYTTIPTTDIYDTQNPDEIETKDIGERQILSDYLHSGKGLLEEWVIFASTRASKYEYNPGKAIAQFQIDMAKNRSAITSDLEKESVILKKESQKDLAEEFERRYTNRVGSASQELADIFTQLFQNENQAIIHGDLGIGNIIRDRGDMGLHDFEKLRLGSGLEDIALASLTLSEAKGGWYNVLFEDNWKKTYKQTIDQAVKEDSSLAYLKQEDFERSYQKEKLKQAILQIGTNSSRYEESVENNQSNKTYKKNAERYAKIAFEIIGQLSGDLKFWENKDEKRQFKQLGYLLAESLSKSKNIPEFDGLKKIGQAHQKKFKKYAPHYTPVDSPQQDCQRSTPI